MRRCWLTDAATLPPIAIDATRCAAGAAATADDRKIPERRWMADDTDTVTAQIRCATRENAVATESAAERANAGRLATDDVDMTAAERWAGNARATLAEMVVDNAPVVASERPADPDALKLMARASPMPFATIAVSATEAAIALP